MAGYNAGELAGSGKPEGDDADEAAERESVHSEFKVRFKQAKKHWSDWRDEAKDLYDFIAGRQWPQEDEAQLKDERRPVVTFNLAGKYLDAVTGLQINNRQDIRYFPRDAVGDAKVNELMTGAVSWCRDQCEMVDEETDAFYDAALTGMGWIECYLDRDIDPDGIAAGRRVDPLEMLPDPNARQRNLQDARYVIRERMMDHDEYEELFGDYAEEIDDAAITEDRTPEIDPESGLQVIPSPHDYGDSYGDTGEKSTKGKCAVQDYQCWKKEKFFVVTHPQQGTAEFTEDEWKQQKPQIDALLAAGEQIDVKNVRKRVYYRAYFAKGRMGPYGKSPYQGGFTYHGITGKRDRNKQSWYALGRAMVDSQRWTNKFFSTILYCLMVGAKGGVLAEENTFKDARKAEDEWADPQAITWVKSGSLSGANGPKIIEKPAASYPAGLDKMMEFAMSSLPETTGMNPELLGLVDREQAGVLEAQRKQSAMAVIAWLFDAMRRYYRSAGKQLATYVSEYMPEGMLVKINGESSAQYVPLIKSQMAIQYDVIADEAPTSTNMKERVWAVVETLLPALLKAGTPIPPEVLDYSPLPTDLAAAWKKAMQPTPESQKAKELEMQAKQADIGATQAKAQRDSADARRTLSEINAPEANAQSDAMVKAQADITIAKMEAAVEAHLEELRANKKAETEVLIARMKLASAAQIAQLEGIIDLKIGAMQADSAVAVAKAKPKPKPNGASK
jgi:hypothetical protein